MFLNDCKVLNLKHSDHFSNIVRIYHTIQYNFFGTGNSAQELFMKSEMGNSIMQHLDIEHLNEATKLYMADFVKMSHRSSCLDEEMVV